MTEAAIVIRTLFALTIVSVAVALIFWNLRSWRAAEQLPADSRERAFARGQFRRRLQTSVLIALLGFALFVGQFVRSVNWIGPYWLGVLLLLGWVVLLALLDIGAIHRYYAPIRAEHRNQVAALEARMRQLDASATPGPPTANQG
ncbi:MAG: hypothetical protein U0836_24960 [Pirellulales bacterium]